MVLIQRASSDMKLHLADFDGPIDLLLHLIREQKLDIKTVRLGEMTKQYLSYLDELPTLDMNIASEFVEVGATLLEIKSRQILPSPVAEEDYNSDPEKELRQLLEEYNLFKAITERLRPMENVNRFYRQPTPLKVATEWKLTGVGMVDLAGAFAKMLSRIGKNAAKIENTTIKLDRFTVTDKIRDVVGRLKTATRIHFSELFELDMTRSEVINTFLAILELLKNQIIVAKQERDFSDIEIVKGGAFENADNTVITDEFGYTATESDGY
jgi:segregation and condensation protein A